MVRDTFAEASDGAAWTIWALSQGGPEAMLNRTEYTQPALLAAGIAVARVAGRRGPDRRAGRHSLGEYTALVAAGALAEGRRAPVVRIRGQLMQDAAPAGVGAMAAVLRRRRCAGGEACAARQQRSSVPATTTRRARSSSAATPRRSNRALALLQEKGVRKGGEARGQRALARAADARSRNRLAETMARAALAAPSPPVVQNVDAKARRDRSAMRWCASCTCRCAGRAACEALAARVDRVGECGPGKVLAGLVKRIDRAWTRAPSGNVGDFQGAGGLE